MAICEKQAFSKTISALGPLSGVSLSSEWRKTYRQGHKQLDPEGRGSVK
jgi:hypothetical protein